MYIVSLSLPFLLALMRRCVQATKGRNVKIYKLPYSFATYGCCCHSYIRVIPQGTVDNNLGPDRSAGPKALETNYYRQPTL